MSIVMHAVEAAVVGGGPAGLMAAEVLATGGAAVTVFDRMPSPGRKLLVAGRGGLNLTNVEPYAALIERYGAARGPLAPAIAAFDIEALRSWCAALGQDTFVGSSGRVFPVGLRATGLLRAWLRRLDGLSVEVKPRHAWTGWDHAGRLVFDTAGGAVVVDAEVTVLAVGGASWPRTGSDGGWVGPVSRSGVAVAPLRPANCGFGVAWTAPFSARFAGTPLKNVRLAHAGATVDGEAMVTAAGIEGGAVYALAASLRDAVAVAGSAVLSVDLRPELSSGALAARLARARPRDSAASTLRRAGFTAVAAGLLREATGNQLPGGEELARLAKAVPVVVTEPFPLARSISTAGGITWDEVDERMMLRRRPGTFVAGEVLDWEAPTGGYLLHACLATGRVAAHGALAWSASARAPSAGRPAPPPVVVPPAAP